MAADSTATIESTANLDPPKPSGSLLRLKAPSISFSCLFRARIGRPTVSNISPCSRVCVLAPDQTRKRASWHHRGLAEADDIGREIGRPFWQAGLRLSGR